MGQLARQRHKSCLHWVGFNTFCIGLVLILHPLPELLQAATISIEAMLFLGGSGTSLSIALYIIATPVFYFIINLFNAAIVVAVKWLVVGRYKEGNHTFYGLYHYKWVMMMIMRSTVWNLLSHMEGTIFGVWYFRAMGAKIGSNSIMFGTCIEADLLTMGDNVVFGPDCANAAHTVENMVIKLVPVTVQSDCSIQGRGGVLPGGTMERGSLLMHQSQVLKGEVVPAGSTWAGIPARLVSKTSTFEMAGGATGGDTDHSRASEFSIV
jgi:hypothetical protein